MQKFLALALLTIVTGMPSVAFSQDARSILETAHEKQLARWDGVEVYAVDQTIMGNTAKTFFQRTTVADNSGNSQTLFLAVPPHVRDSGDCIRSQTMTPEELELFAGSAEMTGSAVAGGIEDGMEDAGLPRGLLAASGSDPNAAFDPRVMMGRNADFLRAAANSQRQAEADAAAGPDATDQADQMARFIRNAKLIGVETVDGRNAYHLQASDLGPAQQMDGGEYKMDTMSIWFDTEHYVSLRMKMDGTLTSEGETRPMTIENIQTDYRVVPGSNMYEPYRQVTKMSGMMDASQQAELRDAEKQLAELEQQIASMPASQRQMMEQMMGPQLEMIRNMASGGGFQTEIVTNSITVNPPMIGQDEKSCQAALQMEESSLVRGIQSDLAKLGFYSEGIDGIMDKKTAISITKYEAARGLDIKGAASENFARLLKAELSGLTKADLTTGYLEGHWCTDVKQEQSLYKFAADGSYRVGVVGLTITQMDGINYLPKTYSRDRFLGEFAHVGTKSADRFSIIKKSGSELAFMRGNCFE